MKSFTSENADLIIRRESFFLCLSDVCDIKSEEKAKREREKKCDYNDALKAKSFPSCVTEQKLEELTTFPPIFQMENVSLNSSQSITGNVHQLRHDWFM